MRGIYIVIGFFCICSLQAQTLGGNAVFNFLSQPNTAQLSALGAVNVSTIGNEVGMSFHNPSLLRDKMHQQVNTSFNAFLAGIKNYSLTTAYHLASAKTNIALGVNYFNYGTITQTDASGNIMGTFRPVDYVAQVMVSKQYHERFWFGATLKYINSSYSQYRSSGLAMDVGVSYVDSVHQWQLSVVAKNMGTQLKTYDGSNQKEELPFDLQVGITKRLEKAPLQFSLTYHHLHQFNTLYNDTSFRANEGDNGYNGNSFARKIFSHLVFATEVFVNDKFELIAGYNFQRRQDLNVYNVTNGVNGLSLGAVVLLKKLQIRYATGFYQSNLFHQLSLNLNWGGGIH